MREEKFLTEIYGSFFNKRIIFFYACSKYKRIIFPTRNKSHETVPRYIPLIQRFQGTLRERFTEFRPFRHSKYLDKIFPREQISPHLGSLRSMPRLEQSTTPQNVFIHPPENRPSLILGH